MPLEIVESPIDPAALKNLPNQYLIFYSSIVDGKMWCPDCRDVQGLVERTFGPADAPSAMIVYVGERAEWKTPLNPFRGEPWKVTGVPTIIKVQDGIEVARLVEDEIVGGLHTFTGA